MVSIFPFRGIYYNSIKIKKINSVVSPPYDIISRWKSNYLYQKSPYNIIRLILPKEYQQGRKKRNKYIRARTLFERWLKQKILVQDRKPSIYIYQQQFLLSGKEYRRLGFISLVKLEDFEKKIILPHEKTQIKPVIDRLNLMLTCQTSFEQIFSLFSDGNKKIIKIIREQIYNPPLIDLKDEEKVKHKLWRVTSPTVIRNIINLMRKKSIFIADGHHRYQAALQYRNLMEKKFSKGRDKKFFHLISMYFCPLEDKGLIVLPTHRLIRELDKKTLNNLFSHLTKYFHIKLCSKEEIYDFLEKAKKKKKYKFGLYTGKNQYYLLYLKNKKIMGSLIKDKSKTYKELDTVVWQSIVLEKILKIKENELARKIIYLKDLEEGISQIDRGECQLAFFFNPPQIKEIKEIAKNKEVMPPKTTYFYPKLLTGLIISFEKC